MYSSYILITCSFSLASGDKRIIIMLFLSPKDWNCKQVEKNLHVNLNVNKCIEEIGLSISFNLLTSCFPSLILGHQLLPSADILYPRYLHSSLDTSFLLCRSILNLCQLRGRFEIILSENLKYYTKIKPGLMAQLFTGYV